MHTAPTNISEFKELIFSFKVNHDQNPTLLVINTEDGDKLIKSIIKEEHGIDPDKIYGGNASLVAIYDYMGVRIVRSDDIYPHESYYLASVPLKQP
ncbi:hypothetical protein [Xanthocytophaga flava]|uniref:hypothetical protein n=1 Tax=Xanthocytophaga flava TaxID=3048013 RepID=UPI0028D37C9A|nr:hypothetical protein [Xanthocytophaga flavus]MDJ1470173.1 hypothetical protein [Xanthocytophaga flavus]